MVWRLCVHAARGEARSAEEERGSAVGDGVRGGAVPEGLCGGVAVWECINAVLKGVSEKKIKMTFEEFEGLNSEKGEADTSVFLGISVE
ncbi:uncharacterized protein MONOS_12348 [Monocercomonoides exilis]|uniref:uncharacterized protein n=1 Tax=Monocercomonoides exilis TaxID=2049356 RepID=UPI0035596375|nr:hypothetical protein MONOS_12348 [Monocercomonoides exilis]|eukprot:MONOS_12348.1-p1 / transcript=MONOS_12348.1 / gene=MONOS_12348 / organism=Monocercomonoides_exilis_PA203 / gene_product=unspecified product / transcript_product=unspecified product / location=Mono_scaffold00679:3877-4286(+) / protein_length=89 / sequence_SO=supercontig / SO=protein_coding / is_pseudo=false